MNCAQRRASRASNAVNDPVHVNQVNCSSDGIDREELRRRALSVVGAFSSDVDDLSVNHDKYLAEAYANPDGEA